MVVGSDVEGVSIFVEAVLADEEDGGAARSGLVDSVEVACFYPVVGFEQAACGPVEDSPRDVRNLLLDQRAVGVDQSEASFLLGHEKGAIVPASEVLAEVLVLPVEVILEMVLHELPHPMIPSKLTHQHRNS